MILTKKFLTSGRAHHFLVSDLTTVRSLRWKPIELVEDLYLLQKSQHSLMRSRPGTNAITNTQRNLNYQYFLKIYSFVCNITVEAYEILSGSAVAFFNKDFRFFFLLKWLTNVCNHLMKTIWY